MIAIGRQTGNRRMPLNPFLRRAPKIQSEYPEASGGEWAQYFLTNGQQHT